MADGGVSAISTGQLYGQGGVPDSVAFSNVSPNGGVPPQSQMRGDSLRAPSQAHTFQPLVRESIQEYHHSSEHDNSHKGASTIRGLLHTRAQNHSPSQRADRSAIIAGEVGAVVFGLSSAAAAGMVLAHLYGSKPKPKVHIEPVHLARA